MKKLFLLLLFLLSNFYSSVICSTKCKEYILIWKEISCPENTSSIIKPIKLDDIEWNYNNNTEEYSKILSYDEKYFNKSYLLNIDITGFKAVCIPILKSSKLHIEIESENMTTHKNKELDKEGPDKNITVTDDYSIKRSLLECLFKNYSQKCDKSEHNKKIDVNIMYVNKTTTNVKEVFYNDTDAAFIYEQCSLTDDYICKDSETINDIKTDYNVSQSMILTINNKDLNGTEYVNCKKINKNYSSINSKLILELTYNVINKYVCENQPITTLNVSKAFPAFTVKVYLPTTDTSVLNAKVQQINCSEKILPKDNSTSSIDCYFTEVVAVHMKEKFVAATIGSSTTDAPTTEKTTTEVPTTIVPTTGAITTTPTIEGTTTEIKTTKIITTEAPTTKALATETAAKEISSTTTTIPEMPTTKIINSTYHKPDNRSENTNKSNLYKENYTMNSTSQQEMYYISPRVYSLAIVAVLAVIGCVSLYAFCLFSSRKSRYEIAPTRDWSTMAESEF